MERLSSQAKELAENLKEFHYGDFLKWFKKQKIGTTYLFQYIGWRKRNGNAKG